MSSSRTNRALEEASKAPSARARGLTITAVILLTLVVIVLISGVFLMHKVIANLKGDLAENYFSIYILVDFNCFICFIQCRTPKSSSA